MRVITWETLWVQEVLQKSKSLMSCWARLTEAKTQWQSYLTFVFCCFCGAQSEGWRCLNRFKSTLLRYDSTRKFAQLVFNKMKYIDAQSMLMYIAWHHLHLIHARSLKISQNWQYMRVEQKVLNRGLHCECPGVCNYQPRLKIFGNGERCFFLAKVLAKVHVDMSKFVIL